MTDINKAVFIRHNLSTTPEILKDLWRRREIAIHYENNRSTNPDEYKEKAAKNALKRLHTYCKMGVVVGAVYREIKPAHILVGIIPQGSTVNYTDRYGNNYIYKVVQLQNVKEIFLADYPLLAAIQPIKGTITGWPGAFDVLCSIAFDKPLAIDVKHLSPAQLEVICHEYLRMKGILKGLLLPIGRSLPDIDIFGIGEDGYKVLAQVTHSSQLSKVGDKLKTLKEFKEPGANLIFFGPESCTIEDTEVRYIPVESVFADLQSSQEGVYHRVIDMMFNR